MNTLLMLKPYLRQHLRLILGSLFLAIPLSLIRIGPAPVVRYMLDHVLIHKNSTDLMLFPLAILGLYALNFLVRFFHYYLLRIVIVRINQKIKNQTFGHLLGLSADYFTEQSTGTLISRTVNDPQFIDSGLSCLNVLVREPITLIFLFAYVLKVNWRLTMITIIVAPLLAWVFSATGRNLKRNIGRLSEVNAKLYSTLQESYSGIRIIKMFRLERYVLNKFRERNREYGNHMFKIACLEEASHPLVELLTASALAPILYYGGLQVLVGKMTPGELLAFFTAFAMMMNPIRMLNDLSIKLHQASAACERIFEIFDWKPNLYQSPNPISIHNIFESVQFTHVSFAYPDAPLRPVLKNLTFTVRRGHSVAIVGPSGTGKSSLVSLLPRVFDVTGGKIEIDGRDIREINLVDLRNMVAVVNQDIFLFNDTIEENIRCGRLSASTEEVYEAARKAYALEFIRNLPEGFKTRVGERGQKLSGGEKQRISIARAFLREAPLLILDEATSNLDTVSERFVQEALGKLMVNRTTLIVAHRLSTIRHVDTILVLKDGEVVEKGNHDSLMAAEGEYAHVYRMSKHP